MASFKYVSCIKIAGVPILPPLVLEEDRKELALYKERAIQIEKKLARLKSKEAKSNISIDDNHDSMSSSSDLEISYNSLETSKVMDFIRQALSDVGPADVRLIQTKILEEMQHIKPPLRSASCDTLNLLEDISLSEDKEPFDQSIELSCAGNMLSGLPSHKSNCEENLTPIQDSELHELSSNSSLCTPHFGESHVEQSSNSFKKSQNGSNVLEDYPVITDTDVKTPPKLIRRNSYTLDSPSPSVLLYLKSLPKYHSDTSSSEECNGKKVVKNLNNLWNSAEPKSEKVKSPENVSYSNKSSISPKICDSNGEFGVNSSNVANPKALTISEENLFSQGKKRISKKTEDPIIITDNVAPEKEKAIIIIQAAIRGYLIRRLMKTNKVMELRNTIKDCLVCALALHSEADVSSADVNLHVRLIRQVTAACYELHSVFFEYSPQEKMNLISMDREKLLSAERAKMTLKKLKEMRSDDESSTNGLNTSVRGRPKRPSSLSLSKRVSPLNKSWR